MRWLCCLLQDDGKGTPWGPECHRQAGELKKGTLSLTVSRWKSGMPRRVIKEAHPPSESFLLTRNPLQGCSTDISWALGRWADKVVGEPSLLSVFQCTGGGGGVGGGKLQANVYPLPQLTYNTALASVNKQSYAASASDSLAFSAQLLLLLFLINKPELFQHLLLCYLWFINMMFAGRNQNHNSARAAHTSRKMGLEAKEAGRLEPWGRIIDTQG